MELKHTLHGNTMDRNGLMNEVDTNVVIKFVQVFNDMNHWGYIKVIESQEKLTIDFHSIVVEATHSFSGPVFGFVGSLRVFKASCSDLTWSRSFWNTAYSSSKTLHFLTLSGPTFSVVRQAWGGGLRGPDAKNQG